MRKFDAVRFAQDYNIEYTERGKSVSRNFIGIKCPFCSDSGHHLGLHKTNGYSTCWFCGFHSLYDTIRVLTGEKPYDIFEKYGVLLYSEEFKRVSNNVVKVEVPGRKEFTKIHHDYLTGRGYDASYVLNKYDVRATYANDKWPFRLIFPIKLNGQIVSYQGRTIVDAKPKYLTCPPEKEKLFHKDTFFNIDNAKGDSVLVVEGVFDAVRFGDNTIAGFGTSITESQINLLKRYRRVFFLFDPEDEAQEKATKALTTLSSCGTVTERIMLDKGKDPGDISDVEAAYIKGELNLL